MAKEEKKKKYYSADTEKMQKKLEQIGSGTFFKPKEGKNIIRILPPWSKAGLWYKEATLHYGLAVDGKDRAVPCLKMFDKDCPVCAKREEFMEGSGEDKKLADKLRPRTKFYANILDRATNQVKIWGFSQKTLGVLLSYASDPDYGDISDPESGFDLVVDRTGTTMTDTRYNIRVKPKPSEVDMDSLELHNLDLETVEEMEEEDLEEIVISNFGKVKKSKKDDDEEDEDEEDEEEDEPKKKKKSSDEDDEDDEDEDEEPKKKKKSSKDDEDDEDDDDEEDEPKKKKKKVKSEDDEEDEEDSPKKKKKSKDDEEDDEDDDDEDEDE